MCPSFMTLRADPYGAVAWLDEDGSLTIDEGPENTVQLAPAEVRLLLEFLRKVTNEPL